MTKNTKSERSLLKKYDKEISLGINELKKMDKNDYSAENTANMKSKLKHVEQLMELRKPLFLNKIRKQETFQLAMSIVTVLFLTIPLLINYQKYLVSGTHIDISYYALIVGLIPVLLIGIYIGDPRSSMIDSKLSAFAELISRILPSLLAIGVSLYAVASHSSNAVLFSITLYGIVQLSLVFIYRILTPGLFSED